jgi:hypothetical protein
MSEARYENESPEDLLERAAQALQSESGNIQKVGRALTEEEKARVKKLGAAIDLINQALAQLEG